MKKLERSLDQSFPRGFKGKNAIKKHRKLLEQKRASLISGTKLSIKSNWSSAKDNLIKESKSKCAYCESYFTTVSYGDVEHFRPKSIYWWLAYAYFNYTAACVICNQQFKKAEFDISKIRQGMRVTRAMRDSTLDNKANQICPNPTSPTFERDYAKYEQKHFDERPLFIDPYFDNPKSYFKYVIMDDLREVWIDTISEDPDIKPIAIYTIRTLGLEREELRKNRYNVLELYRILRELYSAPDIDPRYKRIAELGLRQFVSPEGEYAAMIEFFSDVPISEIKVPLPPLN